MNAEQWKSIDGFDGLYEVSDHGNVRNAGGRVLKPIKQTTGYFHITLYKDRVPYQKRLHRIVADAFCVKRPGCDVVNHIDNNPGNNRADNLEWCTQKENIKHSDTQGRRKTTFEKAHKAAKEKLSMTVEMISEDGETIRTYKPIASVAKDGYNPSCVSKCCLGRLKKHHGARWRYAKACN